MGVEILAETGGSPPDPRRRPPRPDLPPPASPDLKGAGRSTLILVVLLMAAIEFAWLGVIGWVLLDLLVW